MKSLELHGRLFSGPSNNLRIRPGLPDLTLDSEACRLFGGSLWLRRPGVWDLIVPGPGVKDPSWLKSFHKTPSTYFSVSPSTSQ